MAKNKTSRRGVSQAKRATKALTTRQKQLKARKVALTGQAVTLCLEGWSYLAIGEALKISKTRAFELIDEALKEAAAERMKSANTIIDVELKRLDQMAIGLSRAANNGDPPAVAAALRVMERRAFYLGLDAPTKVEHSGPGGGAIPLKLNVSEAAQAFDAKAKAVLDKLRKARERTHGELIEAVRDGASRARPETEGS